MGLDMFLKGTASKLYDCKIDLRTEGGLPVKEVEVELGYWRKHSNLHGYIVGEFADEDNCEPIWLDETRIKKIIGAIRENKLADTRGFFFSESQGDEATEDLAIFEKALTWLSHRPDDDHIFSSVIYQASW